MPSLIPGYEYDIFISYRQKDNKHDGWVTEFVENLKGELETTFKEDISVYFDINPHDGLLESHEVGDSLKEKLKCLIFIPVISRTYCDPRSFAWEHEFKAFIDQASKDQFGLKVKLPGGNVASRVLPVRIYDLNKEDIRLCEAVMGGILRGIEFIYKSAGVNRPLRAKEDHAQDNLNKTYYRDQINKMSHSIVEIIQGLKSGISVSERVSDQQKTQPDLVTKIIYRHEKTGKKPLPWKKIVISISTVAILTLIIVFILYFLAGRSNQSDSASILDKAIQVYDPYGYWNNYSGKIALKVGRPDGTIYTELIEIQTGENYYKSTYINKDGKIEFERGIENGMYIRVIDGNNNPDTASARAFGLTDDGIEYMKAFQYCHFGLLMELKRCGMSLKKDARSVKFLGRNCLSLLFTSNDKVTNRFLFGLSKLEVYIDPEQYTLLGFASPTSPWGDIYTVCSGTVTENNITFPFCKLYYKKLNNSLLAVDIFFNVK